MEPGLPGAVFFAWSRSGPNLVGAGVGSGTSDFRTGAAQKSGGSATLNCSFLPKLENNKIKCKLFNLFILVCSYNNKPREKEKQ